MANDKRNTIDDAIVFLQDLYRSIISKRFAHVTPRRLRHVKVYPPLALPQLQRRVKVYPELHCAPEQTRVPVYTLPEHYWPTANTQVKHALDHERYSRVYDRLAVQLKRKIRTTREYGELNNFEELFAAVKRSAITELYEEFYELDEEDMLLAIYDRVLDLAKDIMYEYRIMKAFEL